MDPGPTISRPYTRHKWVGRIICSQAIISARAQDLLRLPESMTIIKNRTDNLRFSFPLVLRKSLTRPYDMFNTMRYLCAKTLYNSAYNKMNECIEESSIRLNIEESSIYTIYDGSTTTRE